MYLSSDDVVRLARQARFDLAAEEIERFRVELNAVLQRMQLLHEIDMPGEAQAVEVTGARLRDDAVGADPLHDLVEHLSADLVAGFFTVPRVIAAQDAPTP